MSAPPIGMMISTPITKASASIAKNAVQFSVTMNTRPRPIVARPSIRLSLCWPANCTGAPWNRRNLYLPESLPKAITEPLKVIAPMAAPRNSSSRLPAGIMLALGHDAERIRLGHRRDRDEHRRQADHAVEERDQFGHLRHLDASWPR